MTTDTLLVTGVVVTAAVWLGWRAWSRARDRYRKGPCCGEGCGCAAPLVFGSKKKKPNPGKDSAKR
jgi:hypothetical protein